jgi:hypothetical protein
VPLTLFYEPIADSTVRIQPRSVKYAADPIPANSIPLRLACERVLSALSVEPIISSTSASLIAAVRNFLAETDPELNPSNEYYDGWFARREEAGLFLRQHLYDGEITAYVRDPKTGDILRLDCEGWTLPTTVTKPPHTIVYCFNENYVHPDDPRAPGPSETQVRGAIRPVFFLRDEFEAWLQRLFPAKTSGERSIIPKAHRRAAVQEVLVALYGNEGPLGVTEGRRLEAVNAELVKRGKAKVSAATVRRALREMQRS